MSLDTRILCGTVAGAAVGALLTHLAVPTINHPDIAQSCVEADDGAESGSSKLSALLKSCPYVSADQGLLTLHADSLKLLVGVDATLTSLFLESLEKLVRLIAEAQAGQARPSIVADALSARRSASNSLLSLIRAARQRRPSQAAELSADFAAAGQYLDDCVYNISQITGLNGLNRS